MAKINQLSGHMANLIAAGEVVERPSSVVKELVENAIDAGAAAVTVEIADGGITYISVTDNGCGIQHDDVEIAFHRHATSKLRTEEDLQKISTMGFRGEALAAIAAVAKVTMVTKTADEEVGTRIEIEGGALADLSETGCPTGTKIIVEDLFFNTPARHKFLKKDSTEASYVLNVCQRAAISHPEVAMKLVKNGTVDLQTPGDGSLRTVLYCIFGRETALGLMELDHTREPVTVRGFIAPPAQARSSRSMQYFFVNGRSVRNSTMQAALEEAFRGKLVSGKFPCAFLNVTLPVELVDVNVHPAKTEVKFAVEKRVFEAVYYGIKAILEPQSFESPKPQETAASLVPAIPIRDVQTQLTVPEKKEDIYKKHINSSPNGDIIKQEQGDRILRDPFFKKESASVSNPVRGSVPVHPIAVEDPEDPEDRKAPAVIPSEPPIREVVPAVPDVPTDPKPAAPVKVTDPEPESKEPEITDYRVIGEIFGVYVLVEAGEKLFFVDKHAAHERIRYNDLVRDSSVVSQTMLDAPVLALAPEDKDLLLSEAEELILYGFEIEDFGGSSVVVRAMPTVYEPAEAADAVTELVQKLSGRGLTSVEKRERLLRMIACKSAIRSGDRSDPAELATLVDRVFRDPDVRYCPHGRPVLVEWTQKELEKQFKRIV